MNTSQDVFLEFLGKIVCRILFQCEGEKRPEFSTLNLEVLSAKLYGVNVLLKLCFVSPLLLN